MRILYNTGDELRFERILFLARTRSSPVQDSKLNWSRSFRAMKIATNTPRQSMATKVFISWSGELSRKLGDALRNWLPAALQYVKPYFTPEDIEKGSKWNTEIAKELESSNVGIICLTQDNTEKPWILFEAGALSKSIDKSRVCTLLFNLEPANVKGPLTSFQATRFEPTDFRRLVATINASAGDSKLDLKVLESVFEMWWPKLQTQVDEIIKSHVKGAKRELRSDRDILEEILELIRMDVSRHSTSPRISERAVLQMVEILDEMFLLLGHRGPDDMGIQLMERLERPLRHLCMEAGIPEIYERHRVRIREFSSMMSTDEAKNVRAVGAGKHK